MQTTSASVATTTPAVLPESDSEAIDAERSDAAALDLVELDVTRPLPAGVASLSVQMDGEHHFEVIPRSAKAGTIPDPPKEQRERPGISFPEVARQGGNAPRKVVLDMRRWSKSFAATLGAWMLELERRGEHLIINDASGFEIPWEMLTLFRDNFGNEAYLGAVLPVTRVLPTGPVGSAVYSFDVPGPVGRVLAYIDEEFSSDLSALKQSVEVDTQEDTASLKACLEAGAEGYALIYLACHGIHTDSVDEVYLGSQERQEDRLILSDLEFDLRKVRLQSVVFINACHSGRLLKDRHLRTPDFYGFPALFIDRGAPGLIGTVGAVNDDFAELFADDLLRHAHQSAGIALPELLRARRASIVQTLEETTPPDYIGLVSAFMYVYYGNPHCSVRIASPQ